MSDRCSMQIVCRKEDAPLFDEIGFSLECGLVLKRGKLSFDSPVRAESAVVLLGQGEVNYAASVGSGKDGFGDLPKGVPYYGSHGAGCDYGEGVFATDGRTLQFAFSLFDSAGPAVELDQFTGKINRLRLREARSYVATLAKVRRILIAHLRQHSPELCRRSRKPPLAPAATTAAQGGQPT